MENKIEIKSVWIKSGNKKKLKNEQKLVKNSKFDKFKNYFYSKSLVQTYSYSFKLKFIIKCKRYYS